MISRAERRLAAARLAHDAERLARFTVRADAVDRLHGGDLLLEDDPARDREVLRDVLDLEQGVAHDAVPLVAGAITTRSASATLLLLGQEARVEVRGGLERDGFSAAARAGSGRRRRRSAG